MALGAVCAETHKLCEESLDTASGNISQRSESEEMDSKMLAGHKAGC